MWGTGEPGRWSNVDLELLRALKIYEDSICSGCGVPLAHSSELANTLAFEINEVTCGSCQQLENKQKASEAKPGVKRYIKNFMSEMWR